MKNNQTKQKNNNKSKKKNNNVLLGIVAVVVIGIAAFTFLNGNNKESLAEQQKSNVISVI